MPILALHRGYAEDSELATDPLLRDYLTDMVRPYGLALREEVFLAGAGQSYGEMVKPLLDELAALPGGAEPVDVLVFAHAIHDVRLGRATATYLSHHCPGTPIAFAVCDQGNAAAFTGLRVAQGYARTGACRRVVLVVVEQSALHYELAEPAAVPRRHAAVVLAVDPAELVVRQHTRITADRVAELLDADVAELAGTGGGGNSAATVVVGHELAAGWRSPVGRQVAAPAGQPGTGVWWALSELLERGEPAGRVLVADYEPTLGYLCVSALG